MSHSPRTIGKQLGVIALAATTMTVFAQSGSGTSAASDSWKSVQAAALKESKVVLYSVAVPPVNDRIRQDFAKAHPGITLEIVRLGGAAIVAKIDQERTSGVDGADVAVSSSLAWLEQGATNGLFKAPQGPAAKDWPAEHLIKAVVPILSIDPIMIAYNTNLVKTPVSGYQDLLRSEFKGRLGALEPGGNPAVAAWYDWLEKTQGPEFMTRFFAQMPRFYQSSVTGIQSLAAGEFSLAAWAVAPVTLPLIQQGAPLKIVLPKPSLGIRFGGVVLGGSKRPNAALVLMDYLMSRRGQTTWIAGSGTASVLQGIEGSFDARTINALDDAPYTGPVMKAFSDRWNQRLKGR